MPERTASTIVEVPNELLFTEVKKILALGRCATFRVKGNSMRLFLESGRDTVKIKSVAPDAIKTGDVVLACIPTSGQYVLHRVIRRTGSRLVLMGDGNIKGTEECRDEDVVGRAVAFYRKGRNKPDSTSSMKWQCYSALWLRLKPLRRYILAFHRRVWLRIFPIRNV